MRDRAQGFGLAAAVAGTFGICCGIPVLATLGPVGFLAGLSLASWTLIGLGAAAAVLGGWQLFKNMHRSGADSSVAQPTPSAPASDHIQAVEVDPPRGTSP